MVSEFIEFISVSTSNPMPPKKRQKRKRAESRLDDTGDSASISNLTTRSSDTPSHFETSGSGQEEVTNSGNTSGQAAGGGDNSGSTRTTDDAPSGDGQRQIPLTRSDIPMLVREIARELRPDVQPPLVPGNFVSCCASGSSPSALLYN